MNKTSTIWIIAALCVIIVLTAFGVITNGMIQKDIQHSQQIVDAHREGRIRLAMWRLDTLAASIIADEDDRSVYEFKNPELGTHPDPDLKKNVNPFYYKTPETANLYWNLEPSKKHSVNSPQVYGNDYLIGNSIDVKYNDRNGQQLDQLKGILSAKANEAASSILPNSDNRSLTCAAAHVSLGNWGAAQLDQVAKPLKQDFSYNSYSQNIRSQGTIDASLNAPDEQQKLTLADKGSRKKAVARISSFKRTQEWSKNIKQTKEKLTSSTPKIPSPKKTNKKKDLNNQEEPFSTPFSPLWLDGELMLVRKASYSNSDSVQGIWLNKTVLIEKLLAEIHDLFPHAKLVPAKQDIVNLLKGHKIKGDETTMLTIPLRLIHNDLALVNANPIGYMNGPIGLAWLGAILAIIACYFMLKSVLKMSERRAAFVSSVTHELRTPLTTFRLYSDLLSSGMVKDKEKQQSYLNTLKHESERLTHLVENVLSYSQIERGSAKAKVENISLYEFIQRIEPRLNERAQEDEMFVNTVFSDSSSDESLHIDITAVEQIIFNLVDNACKYASSEEHGKEITLLAEVKNKKINIQICDQGDGIARSEQKRLFKPFHKSAQEAANTKPGVGLGLALCKRLAKAMRGDLIIAKKSKTKGACFHLSLPR
ncbi:MAG: signal transduction histidine kinase [Cryomorphaceae bacterium]|jgi:signal transduction histidine kinase